MRSDQKACWQGAWRSRWRAHLQAMQRRQRAFWSEPFGNGCRRRLPLLQLLAVAPLRRVAAPRQSTPAARSHSQIHGQQALDNRPSLHNALN
ncbi:hypothetical protein hmeg3_24360 [Herbaspirillum sp. meg3]|nr:hypothetical protein hmeg3_24360 [Herbaspirillum sp. meg3]